MPLTTGNGNLVCGAYAMVVALAASPDRPEVTPDWLEVEESIVEPQTHGGFDGYSGVSVASVDGRSLQANKAAYQFWP